MSDYLVGDVLIYTSVITDLPVVWKCVAPNVWTNAESTRDYGMNAADKDVDLALTDPQTHLYRPVDLETS